VFIGASGMTCTSRWWDSIEWFVMRQLTDGAETTCDQRRG